MADDEIFLSKTQTAALCQVCTVTIDDWVRKNKFPRPIRIGHKYLFSKSEVLAALEARKAAVVA
jgi:predicted DNA-binding transcriptional regulator AlpA